MICPTCRCESTSVIDSRPHQDETRRRRQCDACGHRFTTREITEERLDWLRRAAAVLRKKVRDALEPA